MLESACRKLLMLGLDGGDLDYIREHRDNLPTLSKALEESRLFEPAAPTALSGSVWPTFYSGSHPGIHGIYQHLVWDAKRMGLTRIGPHRGTVKTFWQNLEDRGYRSVVLDVPYRFGLSPNHGVEVTDWGTHGQTFPTASNDQIARRLVRNIGRSPIGRETPIEKSPEQLTGIGRSIVRAARKKGALIRTLMRELDWDFFLAVFGETHRGGHLFFEQHGEHNGDPAPLLQIYQTVDREISDIISQAGENTTFLIFSVHGMMRNPAQEHVVAPMMRRLNAEFLSRHCGQESVSESGRGMVNALRDLVPARLQYAVGAAAPDTVRQWVVEREIIGGLDWSKTPGFALRTDIRTEIRLNMVGREQDGFLEPGSSLHKSYVEFIRECFLALEDADSGTSLVEEVVDIQALFPGPNADRLPDYAVTWKPAPTARRVHTPLLGSFDVNRPELRGGDHTDQGFALLLDRDNPVTANLPPLEHTSDFAAFVTALMPDRTDAQRSAAE